MTGTPFRVRPRTRDDVPGLCAVLGEQQPTSRYPFRWPLPFPVEDFVVRPEERAAWVAEDEDGLLGHVSVLRAPGTEHAPTWAELTDLPVEGLGVVATLFVAAAARGRGVGRALLGTAVRHCHEAGLQPVLDVVPAHDAAIGLYTATGWLEVGRTRASWLPEDAPDLVLMTLPPRGRA